MFRWLTLPRSMPRLAGLLALVALPIALLCAAYGR